jgi:sugar/nucleoside kinase (ribokinase family)
VTAREPELDVFLSGVVFMDVIFSGLPGMPAAGTEIFAAGLGSAPGGCANLAVALSRLGLNVGLSAVFGDDAFGAYLWRTLGEQEGIDLSWSRRAARWPTPVTVSLAHDGDRSMITYQEPVPGGDSAAADPAPSARAAGPAPPSARACSVHLASELPGWAPRLRAAGTTVVADVSWDSTGAWSPAVLDRLSQVDIFVLNAVEAMSYTRTGSALAALDVLAPRAAVCVIKDGGNGAIGVDNTTGERASAPAIPVEVLDPTGAGGVFDAGLIFATLRGWPLAQRLRFGNLCAGLSVRHHSGSLGAPCWGEIADWLRSPGVPERIRAEYGFIAARIPDSAVNDAVRAGPTVRTDGQA